MAIQTVGLKVPVGVDKSGGAALNDKKVHFLQTLKLAFSEGRDKNAFQNLGIDERIIFSINNENTSGSLRRSVAKIVRKFEDRIVLDPQEPIKIERKNEELFLTVKYIDLATNTPEEFVSVLSGPTG